MRLRRSISSTSTPQALATATHPHAQQPLSPIPPPDLLSRNARPDPFKILAPQVSDLQKNLVRLLGSAHPNLTDIASYYFSLPGKQLRPLLVFLISRATNGLASGWDDKLRASENGPYRRDDLDRPLSSAEVLTDWNPRMPDHTASFSNVFSLGSHHLVPPVPSPIAQQEGEHDGIWSHSNPHLRILPTQMRLAQISEMIHVASLLHDDVLDDAALRRSAESGPFKYGNKLAILGGDFLLGRTSAVLSRLGENEVVELIASVISNLVEGEVMQAKEVENAQSNVEADRWTQYLQKTYFKTASLMAKSARSAVVLGGARVGVQQDELLKDAAYAYGRNMGIAFQIIDDALDFSSSAELGKPGSGADLTLGLATAPALYAHEEFEEMGPLIARRFKAEGDVDKARDLVLRSQALPRTRLLAQQYADKAREILTLFPQSEARDALDVLAEKVVSRSK
ncbi:coq1 putative hexaprenyl diphosphate synthase [Tulasnella sp. 331]|nr:coq1 putative hexaprenyl diphosphate synthase [Tulasnella sp. 331]KAG8887368.1 coq1 putative hexaprenyl diphosphate synthase [Tulasnella sp. 332]